MAAAGSSPCQPIPLTDLSLHLPVNGSFVAEADGLTEASVCERRNASAGGIILVRGLVNPAGVRATTTGSELRGREREKDLQTVQLDDVIRRFLLTEDVAMFRGKPAVRRFPRLARIGNVHHDRNLRPTKVATVLTYLTDNPYDGHTLFPTLALPGAKRDALQSSLADYFRTYSARLANRRRPQRLYESTGPVLKSIEYMCKAVAAASRRGTPLPYFAIPPRAGTSLVFWHTLPGGSAAAAGRPDPADPAPELGDHWHVGCPHRKEKQFHLRFAFGHDTNPATQQPWGMPPQRANNTSPEIKAWSESTRSVIRSALQSSRAARFAAPSNFNLLCGDEEWSGTRKGCRV